MYNNEKNGNNRINLTKYITPKNEPKNPWFEAHFSLGVKTLKKLAKLSVFFSYLLDIRGEKLYNKIVYL